MFYYKKIKDGEIIEFGTHSLIVPTEAIEITEEEYKLLAAELEEHQAKVGEYVQQVTSGEITLDDVPEDYRAEVETKLPKPQEQKYTLDEAATIIAQEVSAE